jgi:PleD family two-component response regulator
VNGPKERRSAGLATGLVCTASVGFALVDARGDVDPLLESADRHLRHAKDGGKDRWIARPETDLHVHAS